MVDVMTGSPGTPGASDVEGGLLATAPWNESGAGDALCLHELIERQSRRTPDHPALACDGAQLTYRALDRRADHVARALEAEGARPDVPVALVVDRTLDTFVAMLAILKTGAPYLPIDPSWPRERIGFIAADAQPSLWVAGHAHLSLLPDDIAPVVRIDRFDWREAEADIDIAPRAWARPENLAYVIYTSGSTGRPKGVGIEHRNIVNYVRGVTLQFRLAGEMRYALLSSMAADLGNTAIFPALATGGCLHVITQPMTEDPALLARYFERERIDVLKVVPSHLAALQAAAHPAPLIPRARLILGGEASRRDWVVGLQKLAPGCAIHNHYGPTETTVGVLSCLYDPSMQETHSGTLPLGKPLPGCEVRICGADGAPALAGAGELWIGGAQVGHGYLHQPGLTAARFVTDPDTGRRWYRSGDLARALPDGSIEFCGRIDDQIKINGNRVEPAEIETALRDHPGVRDALVQASLDAAGNPQLTAYIAARRPAQPLWAMPSLHQLPDGMTVAHLQRHETDYLYHEIFGLQAYMRHGIEIADGDCIVDAGANIGLFTLFASRSARDLRIVALEPNPAAFACLQANASAWGGDRVTCLPVGVASENRTGTLTFYEGMSLLSGFHADKAVERETVRRYVLNQLGAGEPQTRLQTQAGAPPGAQLSAQIRAMDDEVGAVIDDRLHSTSIAATLRTLSAIIRDERIEFIDLLKINVEKSELDVLLGIGREDWPKIGQLVIEADTRDNLERICALLDTHGFDVVVDQDPLLRDTDLHYVYAIRPSATGLRLSRGQAEAPRPIPPVQSDAGIVTPMSLRAHLKTRLPRYMVPSRFVLVEKFPLLPNGKVDRQALRASGDAQAAPSAASLAPNGGAIGSTPAPGSDPAGARTPTEQKLAEIWAEFLKVPSVGIHDDFFDLGGQSLTAIRVVARIRDTFAVDLPLRNLFDQPTVAGLAGIIDGLTWIDRLDQSTAPRQDSAEREEIEL